MGPSSSDRVERESTQSSQDEIQELQLPKAGIESRQLTSDAIGDIPRRVREFDKFVPLATLLPVCGSISSLPRLRQQLSRRYDVLADNGADEDTRKQLRKEEAMLRQVLQWLQQGQ